MPNRSASIGSSAALPRTDVTLYGLVHGILEAERAREAAERRAGRRHPYRCMQLVAPYYENMPRAELQFRRVQCIDLSAAGILYLADDSPPTSELVIALGADRPICLRARTVRDESIVHAGRSLHRVACRFTGRAFEQ